MSALRTTCPLCKCTNIAIIEHPTKPKGVEIPVRYLDMHELGAPRPSLDPLLFGIGGLYVRCPLSLAELVVHK